MSVDNYWQIVLSLAITLGLAVISIMVIRKLRVGLLPQGKLMKVMDYTRLDQRNSLFLVEVEGGRYLVGTQQSGGPVALLRIDRPEPSA